MNSTETVAEPIKTLAALKAEMDTANKNLKKAVRKARVPADFKAEREIAMKAYKAYWSAYDYAE